MHFLLKRTGVSCCWVQIWCSFITLWSLAGVGSSRAHQETHKLYASTSKGSQERHWWWGVKGILDCIWGGSKESEVCAACLLRSLASYLHDHGAHSSCYPVVSWISSQQSPDTTWWRSSECVSHGYYGVMFTAFTTPRHESCSYHSAVIPRCIMQVLLLNKCVLSNRFTCMVQYSSCI